MGVDVDEAGSDDLAACVDFLGASAEAFADRDDPVAVDCDIRDKGRAARTIDDGAAANHQIIHVRLPNLLADFLVSRENLSSKSPDANKRAKAPRCCYRSEERRVGKECYRKCRSRL